MEGETEEEQRDRHFDNFDGGKGRAEGEGRKGLSFISYLHKTESNRSRRHFFRHFDSKDITLRCSGSNLNMPKSILK